MTRLDGSQLARQTAIKRQPDSSLATAAGSTDRYLSPGDGSQLLPDTRHEAAGSFATRSRDPIDCLLECPSSSEHLGQIFAGFAALRDRGMVRIVLRRPPTVSGNLFGKPIIHAVLSIPRLKNPLRITFDTADACSVPPDLYGSQFYFMRSYRPELLGGHPAANRIFPLGLNYAIYNRGAFVAKRALWTRKPLDAARLLVTQSPMLSRLLKVQNSVGTCNSGCFEGLPVDDEHPRILFMTQVWIPEREPEGPLREERRVMNAMRAACIRALREAFPARFIGGFTPTPYAKEHFPDCVLPDLATVRKERYLKTMHASSICIGTTGLCGSTGWKFGEYVAAAKAIVSEPLLDQLPGDFSAGKNYLKFTNADDCVRHVTDLMFDRERRFEMMRANYTYYHSCVRPDILVWNALCTSLLERDV